jgi:hypothetical protein
MDLLRIQEKQICYETVELVASEQGHSRERERREKERMELRQGSHSGT